MSAFQFENVSAVKDRLDEDWRRFKEKQTRISKEHLQRFSILINKEMRTRAGTTITDFTVEFFEMDLHEHDIDWDQIREPERAELRAALEIAGWSLGFENEVERPPDATCSHMAYDNKIIISPILGS